MPDLPPIHRLAGYDQLQAQKKSEETTRQRSKSKVYDHTWRKWRKSYLARNPLCVECQRETVITEATDLHHIVDISVAPNRKFDETNIQPLCHSHHSKITAKEHWRNV